jgi:hypothetical protein
VVTSLTRSPSRKTRRPSLSERRYSAPVRIGSSPGRSHPLVSRAQRSTIARSRTSCARYGGALQNRDRYKRQGSLRSRISDAPLRAASHPGHAVGASADGIIEENDKKTGGALVQYTSA